MGSKDIDKAFLQAAEIAKKLPDNLQQVGFARALDHILGTASSDEKVDAGSKRTRGPVQGETRLAQNADTWIDKIDRTAYPDMGATERVADRALKVLLLAHQDHGMDGLTGSQIATILSRKFRLPVKQNSVVKALERETGNVDVRSGSGGARVFHIMAPGETYLESLRASASPTTSRTKRGKKRGPTKVRALVVETKTQPAATHPKAADAKSEAKKAVKSRSGRPGPKAAVMQLIESGYFRSGRGIAEIQKELQHRRGHSYSIQDLAPALVRSIRDSSLQRERNDSGQYEYSQA